MASVGAGTNPVDWPTLLLNFVATANLQGKRVAPSGLEPSMQPRVLNFLITLGIALRVQITDGDGFTWFTPSWEPGPGPHACWAALLLRNGPSPSADDF